MSLKFYKDREGEPHWYASLKAKNIYGEWQCLFGVTILQLDKEAKKFAFTAYIPNGNHLIKGEANSLVEAKIQSQKSLSELLDSLKNTLVTKA